MTKKEAIKILSLSPFYIRLPLSVRKKLIEEFCRLFIEDKPTRAVNALFI